MFTGLIEDIGTLEGITRHGRAASLRIHTGLPAAELAVGDSLAVNGVCLTLEAIQGQSLQCHCLAETLARTNLGQCPRGARLNLERATLVGSRLGGHIVTGHVDCCSQVLAAGRHGDDFELTVELPPEQRPHVVLKGSITINGVSLTVARLTDRAATVCIIPHTGAATNLTDLQPGARANIETDILGKYVVQFLSQAHHDHHGVTMDDLAENGFF